MVVERGGLGGDPTKENGKRQDSAKLLAFK
jgi:hypothetical protein